MQASLYDWSPIVRMLLLGAAIAAVPLAWVFWRVRQKGSDGTNNADSPTSTLHALVLVTLFLTFDLVMFGAFTRLTDSGLGCPDWPGCYGHASPLGAHADISAAQTALPTGPVTHGKAWIEMLHRYWATAVGGLILVMTALSWRAHVRNTGTNPISPWWASLTLVWVCVQGFFGAKTVTMKLFPAIVTIHLLGGYVLLALLTVMWVKLSLALQGRDRIAIPSGVKLWIGLSLALLVLQAASGGWVSTNYAVLACTEFPKCQGGWWPSMDFARGFEFWRPLGQSGDGAYLPFSALTAIHMVHRIMALVVVLNLVALAAYLVRYLTLKRPAQILLGLLALQVLTGVSNVVLDWPLLAAVLHTGGAGAMVVLLVWLLAQTRGLSQQEHALAIQRRRT